ncbi:MAG: hypothetical protein AMXMBFR34_13830 [Myxococcaceae bacterium]
MTPQGEAGAPGQQPGWFSRNWKWLVGGGCVLLLGCCGVMSLGAWLTGQEVATVRDAVEALDVAARVDCGTPGPGGVDCKLKRTAGAGKLEACWDLEITCTNGGKMLGHACGQLGAGQADGTANMPVSAFSNQDGCDSPVSGAVKNLLVTPVE